jgi:PTH2 family peptidyl-tRNA hydrolase
MDTETQKHTATADPKAEELKMWIAVRDDLDMPPGKLAVQAGHGFLSAYLMAMGTFPERAKRYHDNQQPKIGVRARNLEALERIAAEAAKAGIPFALITDAGRTVFPEPTVTVCAFGPCFRSELPPHLKRLRML